MVKQYVGARYVPKFASPVEWASNTSYEALNGKTVIVVFIMAVIGNYHIN